jgi:iodotyrosine deiodinase
VYAKGEVTYRALPLPDRVQRDPDDAVTAALAFRDYMKKRHSVRQYDARPVPEAVIAACIAAAGTAPSGIRRRMLPFPKSPNARNQCPRS